MLSGFNTNFRYRGVLFHVQTEDSGLENPHVITHLFQGGNIMASEKRDYSEFLGEKEGDALEDAIRKLMEGLHKSMLKQLSRGEHDAAIEQRMGSDVFQVDSTDATAEPPAIAEEERPPVRTREPAPVPPVAEPTFIEPQAPIESQATLEEPAAASESEQADGASRLARVFGDRVVSEKPLDEVVLDYLVENARKRKRSAKS